MMPGANGRVRFSVLANSPTTSLSGPEALPQLRKRHPSPRNPEIIHLPQEYAYAKVYGAGALERRDIDVLFP
jgi:hypothetical protein